MNNNERMLYQNNSIGYLLVIGFVALNTYYTIFILNAMEKNSGVGVFVMLTILLMLLGFLMAIKVKIYSMIWSIISIIVGLFQITRIFFTSNNLEGLFGQSLNVILIVSGILCFCGGVYSARLTKIRNSLK